jgi:hypothetical protein
MGLATAQLLLELGAQVCGVDIKPGPSQITETKSFGYQQGDLRKDGAHLNMVHRHGVVYPLVIVDGTDIATRKARSRFKIVLTHARAASRQENIIQGHHVTGCELRQCRRPFHVVIRSNDTPKI